MVKEHQLIVMELLKREKKKGYPSYKTHQTFISMDCQN